MDLSISNLMQSIKGYFMKMSRGKRIALAAVIVCVLAGAVILTSVLGGTNYVTLYQGLSASESTQIVSLLDSMGVTYQVQDNGAILVPESSEAMLRMQLASEGFPESTLGYDLFTSQSALMTTDYEKKQYLVFQLQDRLQDSLKTLEGVKNAIVTLNVPDDNSFVLKSDKPQASASVVLELYAYAQLTKKQIKGIEELVAKSVPGLKNENVVIVNSAGAVLNAESEESEVDPTISQMEIVKQINEYYKDKVTRFLEPVLGEGGMSVAANVQVDFQKRTAEQTTYTPVVGDSGILSKEEYDRQSTNGGTLNGEAAGVEANTGVPTYVEGVTDPPQVSASAKGNNEYLVNKLIEDIHDQGGQIKDITVAVMINKRDLEPDMTEKYREMVAYAAGISVDKVVVTHAEFSTNPGTMASLGLGQLLQNPDGVMSVVTVILVLLLLLAVVLFFRARRRQKQKEAQEKAREEEMRIRRLAEEEAAAKAAAEAEEKAAQQAAYPMGMQWLTPEQMQAQWQYAQWQQWQQAQWQQPQEAAQEQWEYPEPEPEAEETEWPAQEEAEETEIPQQEEPAQEEEKEADETVGTSVKEETPQPSKYAYLRELPKVEEPPELVLSETRDQGFTKQVKDFAGANPEIVAQLLRTWMKEDPSK